MLFGLQIVGHVKCNTSVAVRENYDDLGPNNIALALIDDNGDLMSNPKKSSTISIGEPPSSSRHPCMYQATS